MIIHIVLIKNKQQKTNRPDWFDWSNIRKNLEFRMGFSSKHVYVQLKGLVKTKLISTHCFGTGQAGLVTSGRRNNALCDPQRATFCSHLWLERFSLISPSASCNIFTTTLLLLYILSIAKDIYFFFCRNVVQRDDRNTKLRLSTIFEP